MWQADAALVLGAQWRKNTVLRPLQQRQQERCAVRSACYGPWEMVPWFSQQSVPLGLKLRAFVAIGDDDEFLDMGQTRNTFQGIPPKIIVRTMVAVEPWSISKDQVWIKMRMAQGQAESRHASRLQHLHH